MGSIPAERTIFFSCGGGIVGFYDNYNFEGLKFLSQIKNTQDPLVSVPCFEFLNIVHNLKTANPDFNITVAEVGIGYGATALQILSLLDEEDAYCAIDFEDKLKDFVEDLETERFEVKCSINAVGYSRNTFDSYAYKLSDAILQMREKNIDGMFNAVYFNGTHTFLHDAPAICFLKELVTKGGWLVLEDVFKTFANDDVEGNIPEKMREEPQLLRVQEIFLEHDQNFEKLSYPQSPRSIFRRIN